MTDSRVTVLGDTQTRAAFARYRASLDRAVLDAGRTIAARLRSAVAAAAASDSDPRSPRLAATVRVSPGVAGNLPGVIVGGSQRVVSGGTANDVLMGAEFGSDRRQGGFRPFHPTGYWLVPTLERERADLEAQEYGDTLETQARHWEAF